MRPSQLGKTRLCHHAVCTTFVVGNCALCTTVSLCMLAFRYTVHQDVHSWVFHVVVIVTLGQAAEILVSF